MANYSRYQFSTANGKQTTLPFIQLDEKATDKKIAWKEGLSRTDKISQDYYGTPIWGVLIMMANPEYGAMEYDIPHNSIIRIPYPLKETLNEYFLKLQNNNKTK